MTEKQSNGRASKAALRVATPGAGKREKFVELAESRTRNAIKSIRVIAKLGNKSAYDYTETDVKKIAHALSKEIDALKARMLSSGGKEAVDFKL